MDALKWFEDDFKVSLEQIQSLVNQYILEIELFLPYNQVPTVIKSNIQYNQSSFAKM